MRSGARGITIELRWGEALLLGEESSPQRGASYSDPSVEEFSLLAHAALAESMGAAAKPYISQVAYFRGKQVEPEYSLPSIASGPGYPYYCRGAPACGFL
jgi:hypothetical protein